MPPSSSAAHAPAPAAGASSWVRRRLRRWWAKRSGMSLTHTALAPSGQPVWLDMARRSARAALRLESMGLTMNRILTDASFANAMVVHAAFGGSTNLILHIPAIAHAAGLRRPTVEDWTRINREIPRMVDALPNGPEVLPDGSGIHGGRSAGSDAASAPRGFARYFCAHGVGRNAGHDARLVGAVGTPRGCAEKSCAIAMASIPTT